MSRTEKPSYHQRIVSTLKSGEWRTLREIHRAVARYIDADLADREFRKRHPGWERVDLKARVAGGRKRLVLLSLLSLVHHRKRAEIGQGRDWDRLYRLIDEARASDARPATRPGKGDATSDTAQKGRQT